LSYESQKYELKIDEMKEVDVDVFDRLVYNCNKVKE
jgi:hypothetical protein